MSEENSYQFFPELFLRAPYYSFSLYDLERVAELLEDEVFRNALWLASPAFYQVLSAAGFDYRQLSSKQRHTLNKYYNRMCFRPTPFGSFATFTLLEWSEKGPVQLKKNREVLLHLVADQQLVAAVLKNRNLVDALFHLNPLLYPIGRDYRIIRSMTDDKGKYHFSVDGLSGDPFYTRLFRYLGSGYKSARDLTDWIVSFAGCSGEEAWEQIEFLVREQVLYTPATGSVIYHHAAEDVPPDVQGIINTLESHALETAGPLCQRAAQLMEVTGLDLPSGHPVFYAATERPLQAGGPALSDRQELGRAVELLRRLAVPAATTALAAFADKFREKFDQARVPLLQALDPDAGIAYNDMAAPIEESEGLLQGLPFPATSRQDRELLWTDVHRLLFKRWKQGSSNDPYARLQLSESDLEGLDPAAPLTAFPPTMAVMFRKTDDHLLIEQAGGATASSLIGRFTLFSKQVEDLCAKIAAAEGEANPQVVFADIVQLSDEHVDNVNRRKAIYPHEIPLNVSSTASPAARINPADLLLYVHNGQLILESARLNKRVIPRLSTAYNHYHNESAVFRLLCDLQYQSIQSALQLDLENLFPGMDFYPRVSYGRVVLSVAKWKFTQGDLACLVSDNDEEKVSQVRLFRERHHLPQWVSLGDFDQQLVFDLAQEEEILFFTRSVSDLKQIIVREYLLPGRSVKYGHQPLAGQYIAFFKHCHPVYPAAAQPRADALASSKREFRLGSDWLYLQLYCTPLSADRVLTEVIFPVVKRNARLIAQWFFIRYTDEGYHLRLRVKVKAADSGKILAALERRLKTSGHKHLIKNLKGDTYRRELERYGNARIAAAETVFWAGSVLVAEQLDLVAHERAVLSEFGLAMLTAAAMIACFFPDRDQQILFCELTAAAFLKEFAADKPLRAGLDGKYRELRPLIDHALGAEIRGEAAARSLFAALERLKREVQNIAAAANDQSPEGRQRLLADLVHMQLNRTFRTAQRKQELIVYYCLTKHLRSLKARQADC
jgi:thiopeptide-type bacteriocin biosynthesis protein